MTPAGSLTVFVIDDDASVDAAMRGRAEWVGLPYETAGTTQEFLRGKRMDRPSRGPEDRPQPGSTRANIQ